MHLYFPGIVMVSVRYPHEHETVTESLFPFWDLDLREKKMHKSLRLLVLKSCAILGINLRFIGIFSTNLLVCLLFTRYYDRYWGKKN